MLPSSSFSDAAQRLLKCTRKCHVHSPPPSIRKYGLLNENRHGLPRICAKQKRNHGKACLASLKSCIQINDVNAGIEIHAEIARMDLLETDKFLGSTLVDMYAKCGYLDKAQEVFHSLSLQDVVSWNVLISAYLRSGIPQKALKCYDLMLARPVIPDAVTYVCVLKSCGALGDTNRVCDIHAEIAGKGLGRNAHICSTLIDLYSKFGLLSKAKQVFDENPVRNVVIWNTLLAGYSEHGYGEEALMYFEQMQSEGISPNLVTYGIVLKSCSSIGAIEKAQEIHAEISRMKLLNQNNHIGNALVDAYGKAGWLAKAKEVLNALYVRSVFTWTALITGYVESGLSQQALECFDEMENEGICADAPTFTCILKASAETGNVEKGQQIHAEVERKELLGTDSVLNNTLINMYAKCGLISRAEEVFFKNQGRNTVTWTALISRYVEHGLNEEALEYFEKMRHDVIAPNTVTYICGLKACTSIGALEKGKEIHSEIERLDLLKDDLLLGNALVDMYSKCGCIYQAHKVFDELSHRDVVSWNVLTAGYAENGFGKEALECLDTMQLEGMYPDALSYASVLKACGDMCAIGTGNEIHVELARKGLLENDVIIGSTLVDMYAKCGYVAFADEVLQKLPIQDTVSWNSLLVGYCQVGEYENVFGTFNKMHHLHAKPDLTTFIIILNACSRAGLSSKSQTYFDVMVKDYGIATTMEHYGCIVDLLGRSGEVDEAFTMVRKMPFCPSLAVWNTLLGACRFSGNAELAKQAFQNALQIDETDSAAYIMMSQILANDHLESL